MKTIYNLTAILLLLCLANTAGAQRFLAGVGGGYATFAMTDTKDYNEYVQNNLPFTPVLTDDFPGWYFYNIEALYCLPKILAAGLKVSATSTGSRLNLADYSGEYTFDNNQQAWFAGAKLLLGKAPGKQNGPCLSLEGGVTLSTMNFEEELVVNNEQQNDEYDFEAMGFYMQPGISYLQKFGKHIILSANVSYHIGFEKAYHLKGEKDAKLMHQETKEEIKPDWNGLRAGIVVYWGF